jgi:hypothetical protein
LISNMAKNRTTKISVVKKKKIKKLSP